MIQLFIKGGPIMWPILVASLVALTVVVERLVFVAQGHFRRQPEVVGDILARVERSDVEGAIATGRKSRDFVARTLTYALEHRDKSVSEALLRAANWELQRFNRGLSILDTIITLAPLLGLLGTVTGMIHSFSLLGGAELGAPQAITGGIAEALIATAFGLSVAILALIPFNYLNAQLEQARHEIQDAASHIELYLVKQPASCAFQTIDNIDTLEEVDS
jgi:biopolymer transport protein ExbB